MSPAGVKLRNSMLRKHEIVKLADSIYIDKMNNVIEMLLLILTTDRDYHSAQVIQ